MHSNDIILQVCISRLINYQEVIDVQGGQYLRQTNEKAGATNQVMEGRHEGRNIKENNRQ